MDEETVVLEKDYLTKAKADHEAHFGTDSTPVIGGKLMCKEVLFRWWAVGDGPYRVIVHNSTFGSRAESTADGIEEFARQLAESVLADHRI